jgi:hypothetical protein
MTSTETTATGTGRTGPHFGARKPRINHVAMSLPAEMLDEQNRKDLVDFYSEVFGFVELPMLTQDKYRLVFQVHALEQFMFLIADEPHMTCARLDHWGISVGEESELDEILRRARAFKERDDRVEIIDKKVDDHGMLAITSIYVRYLLPMMVEVQWWDMKFERGEGGS